MELDDEELKATKELTGAEKKASFEEIDKVIAECIKKLSDTAGITNASLVVYVDIPEEKKKGFMSRTLNLSTVQSNTLYLLDYMHSLIVKDINETSKAVEQEVK